MASCMFKLYLIFLVGWLVVFVWFFLNPKASPVRVKPKIFEGEERVIDCV